jgi:hypothetical protein
MDLFHLKYTNYEVDLTCQKMFTFILFNIVVCGVGILCIFILSAIYSFLVMYVVYVLYAFLCVFSRSLCSSMYYNNFIKVYKQKEIGIKMKARNYHIVQNTITYENYPDEVVDREIDTKVVVENMKGFSVVDNSEFNEEYFNFSYIVPVIKLDFADDYSKITYEKIQEEFKNLNGQTDVLYTFDTNHHYPNLVKFVPVLPNGSKLKWVYPLLIIFPIVDFVNYLCIKPKIKNLAVLGH